MSGHRQDKAAWRLPAKELERPVLTALADRLSNGSDLLALLDLADLPAAAYRMIAEGGHRLSERLRSGTSDCRSPLQTIVRGIVLHPDRIAIGISIEGLRSSLLPDATKKPDAGPAVPTATIDIPLRLKRRGVETKLVMGGGFDSPSKPDRRLVELIARLIAGSTFSPTAP